MITADVDIRGFSRFIEGLQNSLIGTGQDGDLMAVVKSEARQLAMEISREVGPKRKEQVEKTIKRNAKYVFAPGPEVTFEQSKRKSSVFETGITWLYAGSRFLVGVRDGDLQSQMSLDAMQKSFEEARKANYPRGKAWTQLGMRGKQHVLRWNRTITTRERFDALLRATSARIGRLRATFAFAAFKLGQTRIPAWVSTHFSAVEAEGTAIFRVAGTGNTFAIEFGSRAPGVATNPAITKKINHAIENRKHQLLEKTKKVLQGYTYDWNTGHIFKRHRGEEMMKTLEANERAFEEAS